MQRISFEYSSKSAGGAGEISAGVLPQDIGEGLFKSFFARAVESAERQNREADETPLTDLSQEVGQAVFIGGNRTLPPGSVRRLVALLEGQGIEPWKVDGLIARAKDQDGAVQLARIVSGLRGACREKEAAQGGLVVPSSQISEVAALLLQSGLGVGQVRALMEKATAADGSLEIGRLERGLAEHFPGLRLDGRLPSLFSQYGIRCESRAIAIEPGQTDILKALDGPPTGSSAELPRRMRDTLASLLAEKGIAPEKVKSFLEGISLEYAKSILKPKAEARDRAAQRDLADLVGQSRNPTGERWDVREPRSRALELFGQKGSEGARAPSEEPAGEKGPAARPEGRSAHEILMEKRGELKRLEGPGLSTHPVAAAGQDRLHGTIQEAGRTGLLSPDGARDNVAHRETLLVLGDRMSWMIQAGIHKARIRLSPPELGRIDVELAMDRGHLRAQIGAESVVAKEMIDTHLQPLKQHLAELGFRVEEFEVHVGLNDRATEGGDNLWTSWDEARPAPRRKEEASPVAPAAGGALEMDTAPGCQISLRV